MPRQLGANQICKCCYFTGSKVDEDGIEDAFDVLGEVAEVMRTGVWVGDVFIYTNSMNRLNYFVGGEIVTVSHLDKACYILGYLPKENRIFLGDKEMNVLSYSLLLSVMEYQVNRRARGSRKKRTNATDCSFTTACWFPASSEVCLPKLTRLGQSRMGPK